MKHKLKIISLIVAVIFTQLDSQAFADMGPKDQLTVHVVNPPDELYYLDLLTQDARTYNNFYEGERETLNQDMVKLLYSYEDEGWKPALVEGTGVPMWGNLIGEPDGDEMTHTFGYVGLPDTYRIIIVTESGEISVTDAYTRKALQSSITYDYLNKQSAIPPVWLSYMLQFITTFVPTLFIEGIVLVLFGFNLKENLRVFLTLNLLTQIILTLTLGMTLIKHGPITVYFTQFTTEILILVAETYFYGRLLKGKSTEHRYAYGVVANSASWAVGFFLLIYQYRLITNMLMWEVFR